MKKSTLKKSHNILQIIKIVALFGKTVVALFLALFGNIVALLNFKLLSTLKMVYQNKFREKKNLRHILVKRNG